jgi:hypothetical protein
MINSLYIIYTHNRPNILKLCLETLLTNNETNPDRILIIDDGSQPSLKQDLFQFSLNNTANLKTKTTIDFLSLNKNLGYGNTAELGMRMAIAYDPKYVFFIESDYIFSKNGLDIIFDIFENNEYGQNCLGFSGYDNPDYYVEEKREKMFREVIVNDCGEDNLNRDIMFKPFDIETKFGKKQLELVSNSCGTMYFNWSKMKQIREQMPVEFEHWINHTTDKHKEKRCLNDGMMSHGISWLWTKWAQKNNVDTNKYAALLNVKPSVSNHINGAGINGYIVGEGQSFVGSPSWNQNA